MATPTELSVGEVKAKELVANYTAAQYANIRPILGESLAHFGHQVYQFAGGVDTEFSQLVRGVDSQIEYQGLC